jgi:Kef-type K+ transport system membrane component KefB
MRDWLNRNGEDIGWVLFAIFSVVGIALVWLVFLVEAYKEKRYGQLAVLAWIGIIVAWILIAYYTGKTGLPIEYWDEPH